MIETHPSSLASIESALGIEDGSGNAQTPCLHRFESRLKMGFEVEDIVMVPGDNSSGGDHVAVAIGDR